MILVIKKTPTCFKSISGFVPGTGLGSSVEEQNQPRTRGLDLTRHRLPAELVVVLVVVVLLLLAPDVDLGRDNSNLIRGHENPSCFRVI